MKRSHEGGPLRKHVSRRDVIRGMVTAAAGPLISKTADAQSMLDQMGAEQIELSAGRFEIGDGVAPLVISYEAAAYLKQLQNGVSVSTNFGAVDVSFMFDLKRKPRSIADAPTDVSFKWTNKGAAARGWGSSGYPIVKNARLGSGFQAIAFEPAKDFKETRIILVNNILYVCKIPQSKKNSMTDENPIVERIHTTTRELEKVRESIPGGLKNVMLHQTVNPAVDTSEYNAVANSPQLKQ